MKSRQIVITALLTLLAIPAAARIEAQVEVGAALASRNDARIPGDEGTKFSLVDDLSAGAAPVFRLRVGYRFGERHLLSALYAPFQYNARGEFDRDVQFEGTTFVANTPVLAVYRFNSYRLTYRYSLIRDDTMDFAIGFTGKIRDAETSLYGAESRRKTNVGFVPLLNLHLEWRPGADGLGLLVDLDALAASQGRAEDLLVAATYPLGEGLEIYGGYRMVEGGADNDEVYSFAWLHYAVIGLGVTY